MSHGRAVWFSGPRTVEIRREEVGPPGDEEIRVQGLVSAISHGTEMLVYRGEVPPELELDLETLRGSFGFPIKYGYAIVGQVVEAGRYTTLLEGTRVFVHHPHQSDFVVPASVATDLGLMEPEAGVFCANLETAVNVVLDSRLQPGPGSLVVVLGQGVVGLLITQVLKNEGASRIVSVDPFPLRRDLSKQLGAEMSLDSNDDVAPAVMQMTEGLGAPVVIEASGNPRALQTAIECAAFQGRIVVGSWYGTKPAELKLGGAFHRKRLRIVSSQVSEVDPELAPTWTKERRKEYVRELLWDLDVDRLISHRVAFDDAAKAYELIDQHPEETVQVVLTYGDRGLV